MLLRLIYVSRSLSPMPQDINEILTIARKNNSKMGICGALCFLDGIFLQYLEGESALVTELYEKIKKDCRHKDTRILDFERISQLDYPNWSMALLTWNEETKAIFKTYNPDKELDVYAANPATVVSMLAAWRDTPNWMTL